MIKPDGVQRNLVGEIIARFEKKGYKLAALKVRLSSHSYMSSGGLYAIDIIGEHLSHYFNRISS